MLGGSLLALFGVMVLVQCKLTVGKTESVFRANDDLKIAANYVGDARCRARLGEAGVDSAEIDRVISAHANFAKHRLNGSDGELITKQFKEARGKPHARLSGDRFLQRDSQVDFYMEHIEENCRRLVFSVDAEAEPTITFKHGFVANAQKDKFLQDFSDQGFGVLNCGQSFCTFSNIEGGQRYFAMLEPSTHHKNIAFTIDYVPQAATQSVSVDIELENILFRDRFRYQDKPQAEPSPRPLQLSDFTHFDHISDLYVRADGGTNLRILPHNTQIKVSLQQHDDQGVTQRRVDAATVIEMSNTDPRKQVAMLNVSNICRNFLGNRCGAQLASFPATLSQARDVKLVMEFFAPLRRTPIHTEVIAMDTSLLKALLDRKGRHAVSGKNGWTAEFAFDYRSEHLYVHTDVSAFDFTPSRALPTRSVNLLLRGGYDCVGAKDFSQLVTTGQTAAQPHLFMQISRARLMAHFKDQQCFAELARGKSAQQYLKALAPTLFLRVSVGANQPPIEYRYKLTASDIDNWFAARGGIHAPLSPTSGAVSSSTPLAIAFQDRR